MKHVCPAVLLLIASVFASNGKLWAQGFSPEESVRRMQVPPGFQVQLAACEPDVRQPVTMTFDDLTWAAARIMLWTFLRGINDPTISM